MAAPGSIAGAQKGPWNTMECPTNVCEAGDVASQEVSQSADA